MIEEMLEKAIELEGLIRIVKDGQPSAEIYTLILRKSEEISNWAEPFARKTAIDGTQTIYRNPTLNENAAIPESAIKLEKEDDLRMEEAEAAEVEAVDDDIMLSFDDESDKSQELPEAKDSVIHKETGQGVFTATPREKTGARNLKSAFSLNDRFLYSRELFDGDMKMFDSTLKQLEGIEDFNVVEDYFFNELDWDKDNQQVKSFIERLKQCYI